MSKTYDFSHLYNTSTFEVLDNNDKVIFEVTAKQITHGQKADIQRNMIGDLRVKKGQKGVQQQLNDVKLDVTSANDEQVLASIGSWTFKVNDELIPVCIEAWNALPDYITEQIEKGIKVLNPELEDEFQGKS